MYLHKEQPGGIAGEISPLVYSRSDLTKYNYAFKELENFFVTPQGPWTTREATRFIKSTETNSKTVFGSFTFSLLDSWTLAFSEGYIEFYKGSQRQWLDDTGTWKDPGAAGTPFSIDTNSEIGETYLEAELEDLWVFQSADTLFIFHYNHPPAYLKRNDGSTSSVDWTLALFPFEDGPYMDEKDDTVITITNYSNLAKLYSTNASEFSGAAVGNFVEFYHKGTRRLGQITDLLAGEGDDVVQIEPFENIIVNLENIDGLQLRYLASWSGLAYNGVHASQTIFSYSNKYHYVYVSQDSSWYFIKEYKGVFDNQKRDTSLSDPALKSEIYSNTAMEVASTDHCEVALLSETVAGSPHTAGIMFSTSGTLTMEDQTVTGTLITAKDLFTASSDVDRWIRLILGDEAQVGAKITAVTNAKSANVTFHEPVPTGDAEGDNVLANQGKTSAYRLGAWFGGTNPSWPSCATFHEDRLASAGSDNLETSQDIWLSRSGYYGLYSPTTASSQIPDNYAFSRTINSRVINRIEWVVSNGVLVIGSQGQEWRGQGSSVREAISPSNFRVVPQTTSGSATNKALHVGPSVVFVNRAQEELVQLTYNFQIDALQDMFLSDLSNHIFSDGGGAGDLAYQESPRSTLLIRRADGQVVAVAYKPTQDVIAFSRFILGGTDVEVEAVTVEPGSTVDTILFSVKRTIDGNTVRWIEAMDAKFAPASSTDFSSNYWMDGYRKESKVYATWVSGNFGFTDFANTEVGIVVDGVYKGKVTLDGGGDVPDVTDWISDTGSAIEVAVGLVYASKAAMLPPVFDHPKGSSKGRKKRVVKAFVRVQDSLGFYYGTDESHLRYKSVRQTSENMSEGTPFYSGYLELDGVPHRAEYEPVFYIVRDKPGPLTVTSVELALEA
jgi:hypothetical protein